MSSADKLHRSLLQTLAELRLAEKNAVLVFAKIRRRRLYRELGYASMQLYAREALVFSKSKTYQFLRLAQSLDELPRLRESVKRGETPWTKAREVARVATPETEGRWIDEAKSSSRRELERKVAASRRVEDPMQAGLDLDQPATPPAAPVDLRLRLRPEQLARLVAQMEKLRKRGRTGSREEIVLEALEALLQSDDECTRVHSTPYQVHLYRCEECGGTTVATSRGDLPVEPAAAAAMASDARIRGKRNRASIAPGLRARVLLRDGHRCSTPGCGNRHFLEVHHRVPRRKGGSDRPENLVTLCSACHRQAHQRE